MAAEFTFTLREKTDRNGTIYLFGSLELLNSVVFIRKETTPKGEIWVAKVKPYRSKEDEADYEWDSNDKG